MKMIPKKLGFRLLGENFTPLQLRESDLLAQLWADLDWVKGWNLDESAWKFDCKSWVWLTLGYPRMKKIIHPFPLISNPLETLAYNWMYSFWDPYGGVERTTRGKSLSLGQTIHCFVSSPLFGSVPISWTPQFHWLQTHLAEVLTPFGCCPKLGFTLKSHG